MATATSMAAALAASLPAPSAAPIPVAPTHEAIPASMAKIIDEEAKIPLHTLQLDGLVRQFRKATKINLLDVITPGRYENYQTRS